MPKIIVKEEVTRVVKVGGIAQPGPAGPGVPAGGTTGQILRKTTGDFNTEWSDTAPDTDKVAGVAAGTVLDRLGAVETGQASAVIGRATQAELLAVVPPDEDAVGYVGADPDPAKNGNYYRDGGSWVQSSYDRVALLERAAGGHFIEKNYTVPIGVDLVDLNNVPIIAGEYIGVNGTVLTFSGAHRTDYVPLSDEDKSITYKGKNDISSTYATAFYDADKIFMSSHQASGTVTIENGITVPEGARYVRTCGNNNTALQIVTEQTHDLLDIELKNIRGDLVVLNDNLTDSTFFSVSGKNLFNKDAAYHADNGYYNTTTGEFVSATGFAVTHLIDVIVGESYVLNWYDSTKISYVNTFDSDGNFIKSIPPAENFPDTARRYVIEEGVRYLSITVLKSKFVPVADTFMVERGAVKTIHEPYQESLFWKDSRLDKYGDKTPNENIEEIYRIMAAAGVAERTIRDLFPKPHYGSMKDRISSFRTKYLQKNQDVVVAMTGTSLSMGSAWASTRDDASTRPPLLHTNDFASAIFDKLINGWPGQEYRRYDHAFFTLIGAGWEVSRDKAEWYDVYPYKNGYTKLTTAANAGISFTVPGDAWQFNFIYRTDSLGGLCTVSISEGANKMEAWDGSAWVEANGFSFTQLEPPATATKGNTIFQKRLKMRCKDRSGSLDSIGETKTVSITKGDNADRFMFVGAEWSKREFMLTIINGSGGGKNWGNGQALQTKQDSDLWEFSPDLLIAEITTHNWGASVTPNSSPAFYVDMCKRWYFNGFSDEPKSLHAMTSGFSTCDVVFFNDTLNGRKGEYGPLDVDGDIEYFTVTTVDEYLGAKMTCFDTYDHVDNYVYTEQPGYAFFSTHRVFKRVAEDYFGRFAEGMAASGETGETLSDDGTHWNDNGAALVAAIILPIFDF